MSLRIGIDLQHLLYADKGGLYSYIWNLLAAYRGLRHPHRLTGLVLAAAGEEQTSPGKVRSLQRSLSGMPVRYCKQVSGWPRGLKRFFNPFDRVDVFQHLCCEAFPLTAERMNAFLVPDLTGIHYAHFHEKENVETWLRLFDRMRERGDLVLTFSEHTRRDATAALGIPAEKVRAVPLAAAAEYRPLPAEQVDGALRRLGLARGKYVLSVGTLEPRKNHALLLQAFARLKARGATEGHRLVFAGAKGWLAEPIFESIRALGLEADVVLAGHTDHLAELYNGATVMVYPSFYEGFGLPPLEAMACGTPVITSNAASLPEVVGEAAPMVDPQDEQGLAEAMGRLLADAELRRKASATALERAQGFSWAKTATQTLDTYETFYRAWKTG
jgi:glycosyltransferase involved in cell wall biosynthesis